MGKSVRFACALVLSSAGLSCGAGGSFEARLHPARHLRDDGIGVEMVHVKGGCFVMGAADDDCDATPEERPAHEVCVGDFLIGRFEVTQGQWKSVMGDDTSASSTCRRGDCPVDGVSWDDVQGFLRRLNGESGRARYRLPTEAEWEYAARSGGKDERYSGGRNLDAVAWFADNSGKLNHPVGTKAPNGLGIYDMSGNVWEMTADWYGSTYYSSSPRVDPAGPDSGEDHVIRGGCRTGGAANQRTTRRTYVNERTKGLGRGGNVGFRVAMTP